MTSYNDIIFAIITIVTFLQGFYFGRRQLINVVIVSLIAILSSSVSIIIHGAYTLDYTMYEVIIVVIYVIFLWVLGFVISGFTVIKEGDIGVRVIKKTKGGKIKINLK